MPGEDKTSLTQINNQDDLRNLFIKIAKDSTLAEKETLTPYFIKTILKSSTDACQFLDSFSPEEKKSAQELLRPCEYLLYDAAKRGKVEELARLHQELSIPLDIVSSGQTLAHEAIGCEKYSILQWLGQKDLSLLQNRNGRSRLGVTPAVYAAQLEDIGDVKAIEVLLKFNIPMDEAAFIAAKNGNATIIKLIAENKECQLDFNRLNQEGLTPFHAAVKEGNTNIIEELIKLKKIDINKLDKNGRNAAFIAAQYDKVDILKILAAEKADLTLPNYFNCSPYEIAKYRKHQAMLDTFSELKIAPPDSQERKENSPEDYKKLYDSTELIRNYPNKILSSASETVEQKALREANEIHRDKFANQFKTLLDKIKQWGDEIKHGCDDEKLIANINYLTVNFFLESYSGTQSAIFFDTVKQNLESIWFILVYDKSIQDKKKIEEYKHLCGNMYVCAPGLYAHVEHVLYNLTAKMTLDYWLAELRTQTINELAEEHVKIYRVSAGFSAHVFTAFLIYGLNEGWAPLSKITKEIETFVDSPQTHINNVSTFIELTKDFEKTYSPQAIADSVSTNFFLAINKIREDLSLNVDKDKGIPATTEFLSAVKKLASSINLKVDDIAFFDFSDDGKFLKFNSGMFKAMFLKSCRENGVLFSKESWQETTLPGGYKFYSCKENTGWFEKEEKPQNIILNWSHLQEENIDPVDLLGKLVAQLPKEILLAASDLSHLIKNANDLQKFMSYFTKHQRGEISDLTYIFFDGYYFDSILKTSADVLQLIKADENKIYMPLIIEYLNNCFRDATKNGDEEAWRAFIKYKGGIPYRLFRTDKSLINLAIQNKQSMIIKFLAELRAPIDHPDEKTKDTPIRLALRNSDSDSLKILLELKANVTPTPDFNLLRFAIEHGDNNVIAILLTLQEVNFNIKDKDGLSPLDYAINTEKWDKAMYLLMTMKPAASFELEKQREVLNNHVNELTDAYIALIKELAKDDPQRAVMIEQVINKDNLLGIILSQETKTFLAPTTESKATTVSTSIARILKECEYIAQVKTEKIDNKSP